MESLRASWRQGRTTLGGWLGIPSSVSAEIMARSGVDYVCIDTQHGVADYRDAVSMIQAILLGGSSPIVRVPWNEPGIIGRMLDAGAHGIIVPMVNTPDDAAAAVRACRYAPAGARSYGPTLVGGRHGDYRSWAADNVAVIPMVETVEALAHVDEIVAVPGVDAVYVGPADLSLTLGLAPTNNDDDAAFSDALERVVAACRATGVVPGIHASAALAPRRIGQGYTMVTVVSDTVALRTSLAADLATLRAADED